MFRGLIPSDQPLGDNYGLYLNQIHFLLIFRNNLTTFLFINKRKILVMKNNSTDTLNNSTHLQWFKASTQLKIMQSASTSYEVKTNAIV